jgi:thymidylate synthase (FAD)
MRLVKPSFKILTPAEMIAGMLGRIEAAGRTCYKSEEKITEDSAEKFVRMIIKRGHETVIEHETMSVRVVCDRGVTHEMVRHRIASFSQESTRYCNYSGGVVFVIPPWIEHLSPGEYERSEGVALSRDSDIEWFFAMCDAEAYYRTLIDGGWTPQQARSVLPNSLKTEIVMTANLREWRHFFKLRTAIAAHPQMREIAIPMLEEFKRLVPIVFEDIEVTE